MGDRERWSHPENYEFKKEVKVYKVFMPCPKCSDGQMNFTGESLLSYPAQHIHQCDKCGFKESYGGGVKYPDIKYIEVEE